LNNNTCYDLNNDLNNCGSVGNSCPFDRNGNRTCNRGKCHIYCVKGYVNSNGVCISESESVNQCGPDSLICTSPPNSIPLCSDSRCTWKCNSLYTKRDDRCIDIMSDANQCGSSFTQCLAPEKAYPACQNGTCRTYCNDGYVRYNDSCVVSNTVIPTTYTQIPPSTTVTLPDIPKKNDMSEIFIYAVNTIGFTTCLIISACVVNKFMR
jgi:hypothetical protein